MSARVTARRWLLVAGLIMTVTEAGARIAGPWIWTVMVAVVLGGFAAAIVAAGRRQRR